MSRKSGYWFFEKDTRKQKLAGAHPRFYLIEMCASGFPLG